MHEACHSELVCHAELVSASLSDKAKQSEAVRKYDAIIHGVAHNDFLNLDLEGLKKGYAVVYDVKGILQITDVKL